MSERDSSMSMNSLMEAIYGDHHTEYISENQDRCIEQIPQFMQSLTDHLIQLCVTQGFADNVNRTLNPWIHQFNYHQRNPRTAIQGFLKDFTRLFHQQTEKINKYGQKKLKYLTQTVSRQIFTQIMRMACDLKLESVNRINCQKSQHRRYNNLHILMHSINKLFVKDTIYTFKYLKRKFVEQINKEQKFIQKFKRSLNQLDLIAKRKRKNRLWKVFSLWRRRNIELSQQQYEIVHQSANRFLKSVMPDIVQSWQNNQLGWNIAVAQHLSNLLNDFVGSSEGTVVQFIAYPKAQNSLDYSELSSYRSGVSQMSSISIGECLKTDQIKYDNINRFVIIPLSSTQQVGVVKMSWVDQLPIIFFNKILKVVEFLRSILSQFSKISTRLAYYNAECQNNSWHQKIFQLSFKQQIIKPLQIQHVLSNANIKFVEIYHDKQIPIPCVKYGKQNNVQLPENIFKLIWQKLEITKYFQLERDSMKFFIISLENGTGFCRYSFETNENQHEIDRKTNNVIIQCMIPIMLKNMGKIGCSVCNISIKQLVPASINQSIELTKQTMQMQIDTKYMLMLKNVKNMSQAQNCIYQIIKDSCAPTPIFARIFYPIDQSKNLYVYKHLQQQNTTINCLQIPKSLINQNFCSLQWRETDSTLISLIKSLYMNPLFADPQVYLYQHETKNKMKIITKKIGRKLVLSLLTYSQHSQNQVLQILNILGHQIEENEKLFSKKDICQWASQIVCHKQTLNIQNQLINNLLAEVKNLQVPQLFTRLCRNFTKQQDFFVWKVKQNKYNLIASSNKLTQNILKLPYETLINEPVQSQQTIKGSHRTVRISKILGKKLQQFLSYVPNFESQQEKQQLAETIIARIEGLGLGQLIDPSFNTISQYLSSICLFDKHRHQFLSVPIAYKQCTYIFMMVFNKDSFISPQIFQTISSTLSRIVPIILTQKYQQMNLKLLNHFSILPKYNQQIMFTNKDHQINAIHKFHNGYIFKRERDFFLSSLVYKLKQKQARTQTKKGFNKIKQTALQYKNIYQSNCQVLLKRLTKIINIAPFFRITKKILHQSKGVLIMVNTINSILKDSFNIKSRGNYKQFFTFLCLIYRTSVKADICSKTVSIKKINQLLKKIENRNLKNYFIKDMQIALTFQRSLRMLQEQFNLLETKTIQTCIQFFNNRINLILKQCFHKPIKFQIKKNCNEKFEQELQQFQQIKDSQFIISIKSQNSFEKLSSIFKQVSFILSLILPNWEYNFKKHQLHRFKALYKLLQLYKHKNMKFLYCLMRSQKNKQNIRQFLNVCKMSKKQQQTMQELQKVYNNALNIQNRQKHRKQIEQIKCETNSVNNALHQVSVEARIKSKTNAAYRLLNFTNKKSITFKSSYLQNSIQNVAIKQVRNFIKQQHYSYICRLLPFWQIKVEKTMRKIKKRKFQDFMSCIHSIYV